MCFLRDESPESAMEHYQAMLPYRDMVVGIGLDSNEDNRPPSLFLDVFALAREAGFRLTAHCDVSQRNTHEHIRQVVSVLGGSGAERIDHGLNAAQREDLMKMIRENGVGMTVTPWGYLRHQPVEEIFPRIRTLHEAGIKLAIGSDDPAYMEDTWILHDVLLAKKMCGFSDHDMAQLARDSVDMCWAPESVREAIRAEIDAVVSKYLA
jgi:adenosine deaminase